MVSPEEPEGVCGIPLPAGSRGGVRVCTPASEGAAEEGVPPAGSLGSVRV